MHFSEVTICKFKKGEDDKLLYTVAVMTVFICHYLCCIHFRVKRVLVRVEYIRQQVKSKFLKRGHEYLQNSRSCGVFLVCSSQYKEGQPVNHRQGHRHPRLTDACEE